MESTPRRLPDAFYDDAGVNLKDFLKAEFLFGKVSEVILFTRESNIYVCPMAILRPTSHEVFLVTSCKVKGLFKPEVHLELQDKNERGSKYVVPYNTLAKGVGYEDDFWKFLKIANSFVALMRMPVAEYMFSNGLKLHKP